MMAAKTCGLIVPQSSDSLLVTVIKSEPKKTPAQDGVCEAHSFQRLQVLDAEGRPGFLHANAVMSRGNGHCPFLAQYLPSCPCPLPCLGKAEMPKRLNIEAFQRL